jgi:hypothetical protein
MLPGGRAIPVAAGPNSLPSTTNVHLVAARSLFNEVKDRSDLWGHSPKGGGPSGP